MFTVGEFSKICQVTIKTLHYYDRIGLLQPSKVVKFTGYRYYDNTQLDKMLLIQRLKRYGFSLEEIAQLMECTEAELLLAKLRRQQHKLQIRHSPGRCIPQARRFTRRSYSPDDAGGPAPGRFFRPWRFWRAFTAVGKSPSHAAGSLQSPGCCPYDA